MKKQGKKKAFRAGGIFWLTAGGILLLFLLVFFLFFRIKTVKIEGNIHYTEDEVKSLVMDGFLSDNSVVLSVLKREVKFTDKEFLDSIHVQMTGPDSVRIIVNEKNVIGYVEYEDEYWYFNREGIVVERCTSPAMTAEERIAKEESERLRSEAEAQGLTTAVSAEIAAKNFVPEVRGFNFTSVVLNEQLPVEDESIFNTLYSLNQMMNKDNIPADFVMFDEEYNIYLYYGEAEVRLGQDDRLEDKMTTLAAIVPEMEGLSGVLHLENYSDVDSGVVFEKSE